MIAVRDPYVYPYPDDNILKNKFGIKDGETLKAMEGDFSALRIREMQERPVQGKFDFQHLCDVHKYIFQDVFEWAGQTRTIGIEKPEMALNGLSIEYAEPGEIERLASVVLNRMNGRAWGSMTLDEKTAAFSEDLAALWKVHGFREGNTRTAVIFCCDFADQHGFPIDRSLFEKNCGYMRRALVAANAKFTDLGDYSKPEYLHKIVKDAMQRGEALAKERGGEMSLSDWKSRIKEARAESAQSRNDAPEKHKNAQKDGRGDK